MTNRESTCNAFRNKRNVIHELGQFLLPYILRGEVTGGEGWKREGGGGGKCEEMMQNKADLEVFF